ITVQLVESRRIGPIGVGEGTWPTMRNTLAKIGISEGDFIRECDATFKQGARFVGWADGTGDDGYYHPLNPPTGATELDMAPYWLNDRQRWGNRDFAHWVDYQADLCDAGLAPKAITMPGYAGQANYAYHLDAGKFVGFLRDYAIGTLGVEHVEGEVVRVDSAPDGDIDAVVLSDERVIAGDLFVDCTGFAALLIGGVYQTPFRRCGDVLFADRAIAMQVPYARPDAPIACHTLSTAQTAGWIWDIGLWARRGVGYVYSSAHQDDDTAERTLRAYVGAQADALSVRRIDIDAGHRERFWVRNCVAIGLSAGFIEPLEASALMLVEASVDAVADRLPRTRGSMDLAARQFNDAFTHHWSRIIEFLKLHYVLTRRDDSDFWRDNVAAASIPDALREQLAFWREQSPSAQDFPHAREVFSWPSYQYVLHGMRFDMRADRRPPGRAEPWLQRNARIRADAMARLPRHRELIGAIREHGLQAV
ncbi:tryptophan halogenase family protein, partial [Sphingomonas sp.]|uniref:tryptophan halogenase family protein n=1 Tax=Sphingomonas sp. TaxID=28214 RepID=UPI002D054E63